ncbi:hypothetical protein AGLY_003594, partial [Aphis glycines]
MLATSDSSFLGKHKLQIWKKIGEGSFSKVYLTKVGDAEDKNPTMIATKVINKNRVSSKFVEKFLPRELDVLVKLKHPYIVQAMCVSLQVFSVFQNGYKIYINMEFAENGDLFTHLHNTVMNESQIRSWLLQILWAFIYMHTMGVVHRDLKCENILLTSNYNVRIADFGFARFVDRGRNPGADTLCGTMTYSSPELLFGKRPYNPVVADVWAIGVVLYMMANNMAPFRDKTKEEIHKKQVSSNIAMHTNKKRRRVGKWTLGRSRPLINLTATFLEPDYVKRTKLKNALQHSWVREGNIKTPVDVITANESDRAINSNPIITQTSLKVPAFHYHLSEYGKTISKINEGFTAMDKSEI